MGLHASQRRVMKLTNFTIPPPPVRLRNKTDRTYPKSKAKFSETEEEKRIWQTPTHKSCKYLPFYSVSSLKNLPSMIHRSGLQIPPQFFGRKSRNFLSLGQAGAAPNGRLCKTSLLTGVSRVHSKGVQSQNTELCLKV